MQAQIGWGHDDLLFSTRARYAQADFIVAIPDVAIDVKPPKRLDGYRASDLQAQDLRAIADKLHTMAKRIWLIAYDQGAMSALNVIARGHADRFAGLVLISPMLEGSAAGRSMFDQGIKLALDKLPVLVIGHARDDCSAGALRRIQETIAAPAQQKFKPMMVTGGAKKFRLKDPFAYPQHPCNKQASHAMAGLEETISSHIVTWIADHTK